MSVGFIFFKLKIEIKHSLIEVYIDKLITCDDLLFYFLSRHDIWASLVAQMLKNPSTMRETWVQSMGLEYPLEVGMATHSSILAWRIPMDKGAWRAAVHGVAKSLTQLSD